MPYCTICTANYGFGGNWSSAGVRPIHVYIAKPKIKKIKYEGLKEDRAVKGPRSIVYVYDIGRSGPVMGGLV